MVEARFARDSCARKIDLFWLQGNGKERIIAVYQINQTTIVDKTPSPVYIYGSAESHLCAIHPCLSCHFFLFSVFRGRACAYACVTMTSVVHIMIIRNITRIPVKLGQELTRLLLNGSFESTMNCRISFGHASVSPMSQPTNTLISFLKKSQPYWHGKPQRKYRR